MVSNIKVLSEVYDLGTKEAKYTKGVEFRSSAINGQAVSALFVGSPGHILYDENTKRKFNVAFMSKLARRSWFCYTPEKIDEEVFDTIEDMLEYQEDLEIRSKQAISAMKSAITDITRFGLSTVGQDITTTEEVFKLFHTYKRYNNDLVDSLPNQESTYALIRRHLQWKALKLAGAFALFDKSNQIKAHHYIDAMRFCELLDDDMRLFEQDLNKSPHERFSDYIQSLADNEGKASVNAHDIKKLGFLSSIAINKLQELSTLCAAYDQNGIYKVDEKTNSIDYQKVIKTDVLTISYQPVDNTAVNKAIAANDYEALTNAKQIVASSVAKGFITDETTFADLGDMLRGDFAYSPFHLANGVRGKDNIVGGTKWLVMDVDDTILTAEEAHFILSAYNHHIALTSDPDNQFKYRILLELDSSVELDNRQWKVFYLSIAEDLGLKVDPLPQSQIFFSYAGRPVYSNLEGEPFGTRNYVMKALEAPITTTPKNYTAKQQKSLLNDPLNTFAYCYEAQVGTGSINMYRMMRHAADLGAHLEDIQELIDDVNEYWETDQGGLSPQRLEKLKEQARSLFT